MAGSYFEKGVSKILPIFVQMPRSLPEFDITVLYPIKHLHSTAFVSVVMEVDSCDLFTHILQGYFTGTGAITWLPQCQWSNPEGYE